MSDTTPEGIKAEALPSKPGEISALASAAAPVLVFDGAPFFGANDSIGTLTLSATRFINSAGTDVITDRVLVGHIKGGVEALRILERNVRAVIELLEDHQRQRISAARAYETMCEIQTPDPPRQPN